MELLFFKKTEFFKRLIIFSFGRISYLTARVIYVKIETKQLKKELL